jgi:arsenical-resistance protein 2
MSAFFPHASTNPFQGGTVQGSINLPAQSLYPTLPSLYTLFKAAGVQQVIFYCSESLRAMQSICEAFLIFMPDSSRGRGPRSAAWFADYLRDQNDCDIESLVLAGGIKGWVAGGKDYTKYVQNFEPSMWK